MVLGELVAKNYLLPRLINGKAFYNIVSPFMGGSGEPWGPGDPWGARGTYKSRQIAYKYVDAIVYDPQDYVLYTVDTTGLEDLYAYYEACLEHQKLEGEEKKAYLDTLRAAYDRYEQLPIEQKWFRLTEDIRVLEMEQMLSIIEEVYPGEEYINMLRECGLRVGIIDSYTELQDEYVGFDTDKIWRIEKNGTPKLRIFD